MLGCCMLTDHIARCSCGRYGVKRAALLASAGMFMRVTRSASMLEAMSPSIAPSCKWSRIVH